MTAYTKSTNFATKDTLTSGDPLKIVKGTEINTEFDNIQTAVNSKSDTASPTFTGTVTIPTLSVTGASTFGTTINYGGVTLSAAVTGTGKMVLDNSPTLLTPILGAASATSVTVAAGAVGSPSITTTGDTNTGIFFPAADTIAFSEGGAEAMRIDTSGNLLVGATAAVSSTRSGTQVVPSGGINISCGAVTTLSYLMAFINGNGTVGNINVNGSATAYATSSDYRLKNTIAPMTGALAKVALLKPVTYKWNSDGSSGEGFIAHELQAVVPDCVTGEKDAVETYTDEDGNEQTRPAYQGIDTSFLVATLTAAIQEQQALITTLTDRITALENK